MGEIINLRLVRKAKSRTENDKAASENRLKFGRSKSTRLRAELETQQTNQKLDGHQLDRPSEKSGDE